MIRRTLLAPLRVLARAVQVFLTALAAPHGRIRPSQAETDLRRRPDDYRP
ncbi:hypothetical protein [Desertivibrio insolitus]|nr:hypothetical protein [Herbiconiux sp. SYSU D00978]